jgi:anaerobic magnesium-protoporphyrin IX monomethyl ester cyclase
MNVLLINPPFLPLFSREQRSPAVTKSGTFYYPMWLSYAAGLLKQNGHTVKVIDCPASGETQNDLQNIVSSFAAQLIVIDTSTPSIHNDVQVARCLKDSCPSAFIILVGPHVSALPEESLLLNESVDAVAMREYEHTLVDLCRALEAKNSISAVAGLCVRKNGNPFRTAERELNRELDDMPFVSQVYRENLDYRKYFYSHSKYPIVVTITGRGCPYKCIYCVYPQTFNGHTVRYRSINNILNEVEYILSAFPEVKEIMFEDDTLTVNKKRCVEFAEEILKRKLKFTWSANSRADVDYETLKILKKAGARLFCVGIESGDQIVLDNMKKALKVDRIRRFFKDARKAGILIHGCFLVGNPGETKETLETTLRFAKELNPDTAQFFPIMVYPGTVAWEWAVGNKYLTTIDFRQWLTSEGLHNCVLSRPELSNTELVAFCDRARKEFYLRPGYVARKIIQGMSDPFELKRLAKAGITFSKHIVRGTLGTKKRCTACSK